MEFTRGRCCAQVYYRGTIIQEDRLRLLCCAFNIYTPWVHWKLSDNCSFVFVFFRTQMQMIVTRKFPPSSRRFPPLLLSRKSGSMKSGRISQIFLVLPSLHQLPLKQKSLRWWMVSPRLSLRVLRLGPHPPPLKQKSLQSMVPPKQHRLSHLVLHRGLVALFHVDSKLHDYWINEYVPIYMYCCFFISLVLNQFWILLDMVGISTNSSIIRLLRIPCHDILSDTLYNVDVGSATNKIQIHCT